MNEFNSTVAPVALPRLSRENYDECSERFERVPIDDDVLAELRAAAPDYMRERSDKNYDYTRADVLDLNGEPTAWIVYDREDGRIWQTLAEDLPCSVEWCRGHSTHEAGAWEDLMHWEKDTSIDGSFIDASVSIVQRHGETKVNVYGKFEDDIPLSDVEPMIEEHEAFLRLLRATASRARKVEVVP